MTDTQPSLEELRAEIDRIDAEIGDQIAERIELAERVAATKARTDRDLVDADREAVVKDHYAETFQACGLSADRGRAFAEFLIESSLEREQAVETDR